MAAKVALLDCEDAAKWTDHLDIWRDALMAPESGSICSVVMFL